MLMFVQLAKGAVIDADLICDFKLIEGTVPAQAGATALFIDRIGLGGGVGVGFY